MGEDIVEFGGEKGKLVGQVRGCFEGAVEDLMVC